MTNLVETIDAAIAALDAQFKRATDLYTAQVAQLEKQKAALLAARAAVSNPQVAKALTCLEQGGFTLTKP